MNNSIERFRKLLSGQTDWPMLYYFKFIIKNDQQKLDQVKSLFIDQYTITYKTSKDLKYISLSCKQYMTDPESIISIYEKAGLVEGLIAL
jgi:hypothetical protein